MARTLSVRLTEQQLATIEKWRRRWKQRSAGSTLQLLLEEKLREEEHPHIIFRDTAVGRRAFVAGTGLAVWEVMMILRAHEGNAAQTATNLRIPEALVQAALDYRDTYPGEIDAELAETEAIDFETLQRLLPNIEPIDVET